MKKLAVLILALALIVPVAAFAAPKPGCEPAAVSGASQGQKPGEYKPGQPGQPGKPNKPGTQGQPMQPGAQGGQLYIEEMKFKRGDTLEVEFDGGHKTRIQWSGKERFSVTDRNGKGYRVEILRREKDEIKLRVRGLQPGAEYRLTIEGINCNGKRADVRENFVARDGWKMDRH